MATNNCSNEYPGPRDIAEVECPVTEQNARQAVDFLMSIKAISLLLANQDPNEAELDIELADTFRKRVQGLSGRIAIEENKGLFFVFDESDFHSIWMKEMFFPIDIIWIDESLHIVDIKKNALPESYPEVFRPKDRARYVLEVNAGFADEFDLRINDSFSF